MNLQRKQVLSLFEEKGFDIFAIKAIHTLSDQLKSALPTSIFEKQNSIGIIGSGGKKLWRKLQHPLMLESNPIDMYSIRIMLGLKETYLSNDPNFKIIFPDDRYILPLQKISREFNLSHQSPTGLDISKNFGLWFSIRGIFTCSILDWNHIPEEFESPCLTCEGKPCLKSIDARISCPYQKEQSYDQEQIDYHAKALFKI